MTLIIRIRSGFQCISHAGTSLTEKMFPKEENLFLLGPAIGAALERFPAAHPLSTAPVGVCWGRILLGIRTLTKEYHMPEWVDYKTLRQELKFADLLEYYQIEINAKNGQHKGLCPLPGCRDEEDRKPTFSANLERGIFQCFCCGAKGNQIEWAILMEGLNPDDRKEFRKGALILAKRFGLARENDNKKYRKTRTVNGGRKACRISGV